MQIWGPLKKGWKRSGVAAPSMASAMYVAHEDSRARIGIIDERWGGVVRGEGRGRGGGGGGGGGPRGGGGNERLKEGGRVGGTGGKGGGGGRRNRYS